MLSNRKINRLRFFFYFFVVVAVFFLSSFFFLSSSHDVSTRPVADISIRIGVERLISILETLQVVVSGGHMERDLSQVGLLRALHKRYRVVSPLLRQLPFDEIIRRYTEREHRLWSITNDYVDGSTLSADDVRMAEDSLEKMLALLHLLETRLTQKDPNIHTFSPQLFVVSVSLGMLLVSAVFGVLLIEMLRRRQTEFEQRLRVLTREFYPSSSEPTLNLVQSLADDIHEEKKELQRLDIIRKRFQKVFDALPLGIVAFDSTGTIVLANRRFSQLFWNGQSPAGEQFQTVLSAAGIPANNRGKILCHGTYWWITEHQIDSNTYLVFQDITEQEQMASKLLNSERLISIGEMASRITHEIRNPLSTIKMNSEYVLEHFGEMSSEDIVRAFQPVIKEIDRLDQITAKYINMVKYRTEVTVSSAVIPDDLAELIAFHRAEIEARNIEFDVILPNKPITLTMPADAFREVILNLMKNSWEEIQHDGRIRVRAEMESDTILAIHVEDSGSGIEDSLKTKIFETFFTGKEGGTGIGLSHTKSLIVESGGSITVVDSVLGGADFVVRIPIEIR